MLFQLNQLQKTLCRNDQRMTLLPKGSPSGDFSFSPLAFPIFFKSTHYLHNHFLSDDTVIARDHCSCNSSEAISSILLGSKNPVFLGKTWASAIMPIGVLSRLHTSLESRFRFLFYLGIKWSLNACMNTLKLYSRLFGTYINAFNS